jgi:formylglycine-generating enzyme required for sulfatase activity
VTQTDYNLSIAKPLDKPRKITLNGEPFEPGDASETTQPGQVRFDFTSLKAGPNHFKVRFYGAWLQENFETDLTLVFFPESEWKAPHGLDMVAVPAGCFDMGCGPWTDNCDPSEKPVHHVCLAAFTIGKFEVTQGQWEALMGHNPSFFKGDTRLPVENVSWEHVQECIRRLNQVTGQRYRLPSEAQWEYAARSGGRPEKYAGGEDLDKLGWYGQNSGGSPRPVGGKAANGLGLHDMSGNVWEWCQDWYGDYLKESVTDPSGPSSGSGRVIRGGSWYDPAGYCRSACRSRAGPGDRRDSLGFRLVLLPGQPG